MSLFGGSTRAMREGGRALYQQLAQKKLIINIPKKAAPKACELPFGNKLVNFQYVYNYSILI
jgi:hypothetical protein